MTQGGPFPVATPRSYHAASDTPRLECRAGTFERYERSCNQSCGVPHGAAVKDHVSIALAGARVRLAGYASGQVVQLDFSYRHRYLVLTRPARRSSAPAGRGRPPTPIGALSR